MTPSPAVAVPQPERTGLIIGLGLLGLCCFPLGVIAGVLALLSLMRARKQGRAIPPIAIIGLSLAGLSLLTNGAAIMFGRMKDAERQAQAADLQKKLDGKREAATLDAETACSLAQLYFVTERDEFTDKVVCEGSLSGTKAVPSLPVKTVKGTTASEVTMCFARGPRWYVLAALHEGDGECATEAPKTKGQAKTEDDLELEESAARSAEKERLASARITRFEDRLAALRDEVEDVDGDSTCEKMKKGSAPTRVAFLEARMLSDDGRAQDDWDFLTQGEMRSALLSTKAIDRAKSIRTVEAQGDVIAIIKSEVKAWPKTTGDSTFIFGELEGYVLVANLKDGKVLCSAYFRAQSSTDVSSTRLTKLETREHALERAIEKDFKAQVKARTSEALKKLSHGSLEFDWGFFD